MTVYFFKKLEHHLQIFQILGFSIIPIIYLFPSQVKNCKNKNIVLSRGGTLVKSKTVINKDMYKSMQHQTGGKGGTQSPVFTKDRRDQALCVAISHLG